MSSTKVTLLNFRFFSRRTLFESGKFQHKLLLTIEIVITTECYIQLISANPEGNIYDSKN